jgi:hypothetical protein
MKSLLKAPSVLVIAERDRATAWPSPGALKHTLMPVRDALMGAFDVEAHMALYTAEWEDGTPVLYRLKGEAIGRVRNLTVNYFHVDADAPKAVKEAGKVEVWKQEELPKYLAMHADMGAFIYHTINGFHTHALMSPFAIEDEHDPARYSAMMRAQMDHIKRRYDIDADPKCVDWTRLHRLPHGTRQGQIQMLPFLGDV